MNRSPMNVVSKFTVGHDKDTDVAHGTQIHKLTDIISDESLIDEHEEDNLHYSCSEKKNEIFIDLYWILGKFILIKIKNG